MQLISVLLIIASILGLLSGFFVIIGSEKESRPFAIFFGLFSLVYVFWTSSMITDKLHMANINISVVFFLISLLITIWSFANSRINKNTRMHKGWRLVALSLMILADVAALIYYIIVLTGSSVAWIAPLVLAPLFVIFFYAAIRYRILQISNRVCKIWAYFVLSICCVAVYMCLFALISQYLFHVEVSDEIIALNLLLVIILVAIFPLWNEFNSAITSVLSTNKVNLNFIIKTLNRYATQNVRLRDLAEFLADHLHFRYVGLVIDGKVYGTKKVELTDGDMEKLMMLDTKNGKNIWLEPTGHIKEIFEKEKIFAAAELRNAKGRPFGQILIGHPMGKTTFEKRDLASVEMIVNLVASIIDSKERLEK